MVATLPAQFCKGDTVRTPLLILLAAIHCFPAHAGSQVQTDLSVVMNESFAAGTSFEVTSTVTVRGSITKPRDASKPPTQSAISTSGATRYRERLLEVPDPKQVTATVRRYLSATLDHAEKKSAEAPPRIVLRSAVERIVVRRMDHQTTAFSPDGPLTAPELDLLKADPAAFTPALIGLLPLQSVKSGDRWDANAEAAAELTGVDPLQSGNLRCVLREISSSGKMKLAKVGLVGSLSGPTELGPARITVEGHFLFDLDRQLITYLVLSGRSEIFGSDGKVTGVLEGRYELSRGLAGEDPRLTDTALAGLELKPNRESTAMLFEQKNLGVRFLYPRNWELGSVKDNLIQLDDPTGGRMRVTIDAKPVPNAERLRGQLLTWLESRKATVKEPTKVQTLQVSSPSKAERFSVQAVLDEKPREWNYVLIRQADRSATLAAGLTADRAPVLNEDVEFVARRLEFLPKHP